MASSKPRTYFQGNKQLIRELIQLSQQNRREDLLPLGRSFFLYFTNADEYYVSDLVFITSGSLAGNAMVAIYNGNNSNSLVYFPIGADGLPVGGVDVTPTVFASGYTGAWGVAVDPVSNNIWMIDYDETDGVAMTQIGALSRGATPTNAIPTMSAYGVVLTIFGLILLVRRRVSSGG